MEVINNDQKRPLSKIETFYLACSECSTFTKFTSSDVKIDEQNRCYLICKCGNKVEIPYVADRT